MIYILEDGTPAVAGSNKAAAVEALNAHFEMMFDEPGTYTADDLVKKGALWTVAC